MKNVNFRKIVVVFFVLMSSMEIFAESGKIKNLGVHNKPSVITSAYKHMNHLSTSYVLRLSGPAVCNYIPKKIDEAKVAKGESVTLAFFLPLATIKSGAGKDAIDLINNEPCDATSCLRIRPVQTPIQGLQCDITLDLNKHALEYQSFKSINGEQGILFKFNHQEKLKHLNTTTASQKIRRVAMTEKPRIVIDFGHGGKDPGFINEHVREKDINFAIGQILTDELKKKGYQVCLTRSGDEYLSLDQRTARAQECPDAQALISLHANSAPFSDAVSGIETFCHKQDLFTSHMSIGDSQILAHANQIDKIITTESNQLAHSIHTQLLNSAKKQYSDVVDRKIKHRVSQLILGSTVPSVLLEVGFLTNKKEATRLQDSSYQRTLAQGICKGLDDFFNVM